MFGMNFLGPVGAGAATNPQPGLDSEPTDMSALLKAYAAAKGLKPPTPTTDGPDFMARLRAYAASREPQAGSAIPGVTGAAVPPQAPQAAPPAPMPPGMASPAERVSQGHNAFGPTPMQTAMATPAPLPSPTMTPPIMASSAPPSPQAPPMPLPTPRPDSAPQAPPPMNAFQRNSAMMTDPITGSFIDPTNAARAQASGPDVINKLLKYFHTKDA